LKALQPYTMSAFTGRTKIKKEGNAKPDATEEAVAQAIYDLELNNADFKADLRSLYIVGAKQLDLPTAGQKALIITVPYVQHKRFRGVQTRLIRELEKKFPGSHVNIIASRRILPKERKTNRVHRQKVPVSRTLTAVHEALLEDIVFPTEIVGKRLRYRLDGSRLYKVQLDKKEQANVVDKIVSYATVYKKLTGKDVVFEFASGTLE